MMVEGNAALDPLIERLTPGGRLLLWIVTRPGGPVPHGMFSRPLPGEPSIDELHGSGVLVRDGDFDVFSAGVAERANAWMERHPEARSAPTEGEVWSRGGRWYGAQFSASRAPAQRRRTSEAGRWATRYLVAAPSLSGLRAFARGVIAMSEARVQLDAIVADLAASAPWQLRACLANAAAMDGPPLLAHELYVQAADEAQAAKQWPDLVWICTEATLMPDPFDVVGYRRGLLLRLAEAQRHQGQPRTTILEAEIQALAAGFAVSPAAAETLLVDLDGRLAEARALWALEGGHPAPESLERRTLARALILGLDLARRASARLERWQRCLDLLAELEEVDRVRGLDDVGRAERRWEAYPLLLKAGRLAEARATLEAYVDLQRRAGTATREAWALVALAHVCHTLGDGEQAISCGLQAVAVRDGLSEIDRRILAHSNLAAYLHEGGSPAEALSHRLAALVYEQLWSNPTERHQGKIRLANHMRQSATGSPTFKLPRLAAVIGDPRFAALGATLADRKVDLPRLQVTLDRVVVEAREELRKVGG